jgi:hypothetical protein
MKGSLTAAVLALLSSACAQTPPFADAGTGAQVCPVCVTLWDGGACSAGVVASVDVTTFDHVDLGSVVDYNSNPPAGGDHYPYWAIWGIHTDVVPTEYFVHNQEHGGVILLYNCPNGCPDIVNALTAVMNDQPIDPVCVEQGEWADDAGVPNRMLMTSDPDLDVPVAAAAWGWTYKEADPCVDVASLQAFITAHYGIGRLSCPGGSCSTTCPADPLPDAGEVFSCEVLCTQGLFP